MVHSNRRLVPALLLIVGLAWTLEAQSLAATVTITGRVIAEATGQPARRAYVVAHGAGTRTTRVTMSDLEGVFSFEALPPDRYRVGASKRPHLSAAVDAGGSPVVIRLPTGAVATGTVLDHTGQPASFLVVSASGTSLPSPQTVSTNLKGEYRFFSLPPGEYLIGAVRRKGESLGVIVGPGEEQHLRAISVEPMDPIWFPDQQPVPEGNNAVGGIALDAISGLPLPDAPVAIGRSSQRTLTDTNGRFQFERLGPETYSLQVTGAGFYPWSSAEVTLTDNTRVTDVTLRARRQGSVSGTVRDDAGDAIVGMPVVTYQRRTNIFLPLPPPRARANTDDRGMFQINALAPGDYVLCACADAPLPIDPLLLRLLGPSAPDAATLGRLIDDTVQTFPPTYYPGQTRAVNSHFVTIGSGDDRMGMDITMLGVKPFEVSGQLVENGGLPSRPMQVLLAQDSDLPGANGLTERRPVEFSADGRFRFSGVPPGSYSLGAVTNTQHPGPWALTEVSVVDRDVENLVVALGKGVSVSGRAEFAGRATRPVTEVLDKTPVSLVPLDMSMTRLMSMLIKGSIGHNTTLDESGRFTMEGLSPGRYRVAISVPDPTGWTVARVTPAEADGLDDVLTIPSGGAADVLITMSDPPMATLTGSATLDRYEPPGNVYIVVFPQERAMWLETERHARRFRSGFLNRDLSFRMPSVPPGEYYVGMISTLELFRSAPNLDRWAQTATRVTLRPGGTTEVALKR